MKEKKDLVQYNGLQDEWCWVDKLLLTTIDNKIITITHLNFLE
jgi:hypothetical protein